MQLPGVNARMVNPVEEILRTREATTVSAASKEPMQSGIRLLIAFMATISALAVVLVGAAFITWVNLDNSITWPLDEAGGKAVYPPGHFLTGDLLAGGLAITVTLLVVSALVLLPRQLQRVAKRAYAWNIVWLGASLGLLVIVTIRYSIYLASPLLVSALVAWILLSQSGKRLDSTR